MSYAIAFSSEARDAFARLDLELQEDVLDELDRIAGAADVRLRRPLPEQVLHDLRRETSGGINYIFLTIEYNAPHRLITVVRIGSHTRAK